jgi:hypothetical protein
MAEKFTIKELAAMHGQLAPAAPDGCEFKAEHACANVYHGWSRIEYHYGTGSVKLTVEDYRAALEASAVGTVHEPARAVAPSAPSAPSADLTLGGDDNGST